MGPLQGGSFKKKKKIANKFFAFNRTRYFSLIKLKT
jgi:hypothetical protein